MKNVREEPLSCIRHDFAVKAELTKRGLNAREDTGGRGDIHTAPYKSYHTTTPNGFDLQISATTRASRND